MIARLPRWLLILSEELIGDSTDAWVVVVVEEVVVVVIVEEKGILAWAG